MSNSWQTCYIGLGSNLDNPREQVSNALTELAELTESNPQQCRTLCHSSLYRSDPVGPPGQPDYINAVACLETRLSPLQLLDALQAIEQTHQRVRIQHWGPRTLDLDLLLYGDQVIQNERLTVPHTFMKVRNFVLYPLAEIAPNLTLPDGNQLSKLLKNLKTGTLEKI